MRVWRWIPHAPAARRVAGAAAVGWMAVIFWLSSLPGSAVPGRLGQFAHPLEYAVLASLLYIARRRFPADARAAAAAILVAAAYAVTDEVHQAFVPGRVPDIADWGLDVLGAGAAAIALMRLDERRTA